MLRCQFSLPVVLCVVIATNVLVRGQDNIKKNEPSKENPHESERTYVFKESGQVIHNNTNMDDQDKHHGKGEALIEAFQARQEALQDALKSGKGGLDPNLDEEKSYQRLREDLKKEGNGTFFDPEVEAERNSVDQPGRRKRLIEKPLSKRWPKAIVPFVVKAMDDLRQYKRAMSYVEEYTCVRFVNWTQSTNGQLGLGHDGQLNFIDEGGCWSYQGNMRWAGGQSISCCGGITCVHEIGHALGMVHENQNPLRDGWIRVNPQNIKKEYLQWYARLPEGDFLTFDSYDLSSIMHYKKWEEPCANFKLKCENDGYVSLVRRKCVCRCPTGLDPDTGCTTALKKVSTDLKMPKGQYALLKPKTGCPDDSFKDGQVIHYGEGNSDASSYLLGEFKGAKADERFCTRNVDDFVDTTEEVFNKKSDWPAGNYCILRKGGKCPDSFYPGFIQYDDMPQDDGQVNSHTGDLPDGVFGEDTRVEFCCQFGGFAGDPIVLPATKPFILFAGDGGCQGVVGMNSRVESYTFDNHKAGGVFGVGGDFKRKEKNQRLTVYICYYTPADMNCGGVITLDESNPQTTVEMSADGRLDLECTWLIKGPNKDGTLLVNFDQFDIKEDGNDCVDKLEVRHAKIGQRGLFYCGKDDKRTIRSIFDKMIMRFTTVGSSNSQFKATVKWVPNSEMCYDVTDKGVTYAGQVNYTRTFDSCLPWTEVTECPHHPWKEGDELDNLEENYCRNPDNSLRPWCYTDKNGCKRNYCDVCKLENRFDRKDSCTQLKQEGFCTKDVAKAIYDCAKTCSDLLPATEPLKKYTEIECDPPVIPSDGEIVGDLKAKYKLGDKASVKCKQSADVTTTICMSNGHWTPLGTACTECPTGSIVTNTSCYVFKDDSMTYVKAKEFCTDFGGLVSMPKNLEKSKEINIISHGKAVWMGLTDIEAEGTWVWEDGTPASWINWGDGEPNNYGGQEDCSAMHGNDFWVDLYCDWYWAKRAVVCERPRVENIPCEDYLGDRCIQLLADKTTMCTDYPSFSEEYCAKSCGVCGGGIKCPVQQDNPNVIVSTKETSISLAASVTYTCKDGYHSTGGSEARMCIHTGQLSGKPLKCEKTIICEDALGNGCVQKLSSDPKMCSIPKTQEDCAKTCGVCGAEDIKCPVQTDTPGVKVSTDAASISVGAHVTSSCNDGYHSTGGSQVRACQTSGQLTGTPLKCEETNPCVNFLEDGCDTLLANDATLCSQQYSNDMCEKTCGICTDENIKCPVQTDNPGVKVSSDAASISVGAYVSYLCKDGYHAPNGGTHLRACQTSGQLTGTPLNCEEKNPCVDFLDDACLMMLAEDPKLCSDPFSTEYCAKTCGQCRR